ncbi:hypothetical protein F6V25_16355 [Oryzomonas japonica]|uniref:Uncharacterized protein n=1 Tax=Oryzomonas japonica TaxID=2603858 RepID=A0A7J4ZME7_9BACT|nr:hypothetical protein [Oryzomonas japonica]KAB0663572.1 hypothetical protein F6V25_16355 [Oryzomonas japonica]
MRECQGAIILGYPQIIVETGSIKDQRIDKNIKLPTEWNQIEAALAYEMELPLLVIHDIGITRGIFDRGTLNAFIYEVDLSMAGWCLEESVSGSITTWNSRLTSSPPKSTPPIMNQNSKIISLRNDFVQILNRSYYKRCKKSFSNTFEYTGYNLDYGLKSPLSGFLQPNNNPGYQRNAADSGIKTKNDVLRVINDQYPEVYTKLIELFNKDGANLDEIYACFNPS